MADADSKPCKTCGQTLPLDAFTPHPTCKFGRLNNCRQCKNKIAKAKYAIDLDASREYARRSRNPETQKAYYHRNRERIFALIARHRKANPEMWRATSAARRAKKKSETTSKDVQNWARSQKKTCHWCGVGCSRNYHIDHIHPLSKGGEHMLKNLCIACPTCNMRKGAKDPIEWAQSLGKLL